MPGTARQGKRGQREGKENESEREPRTHMDCILMELPLSSSCSTQRHRIKLTCEDCICPGQRTHELTLKLQISLEKKLHRTDDVYLSMSIQDRSGWPGAFCLGAVLAHEACQFAMDSLWEVSLSHCSGWVPFSRPDTNDCS